MDIRTILLPVDGSEHSRRATAYAIDLARVLNAEIVALHCQPPVPAYLGEPNFGQAEERRLAHAEALMAPVEARLRDGGTRFKTLIVEGAPGEAIADAIKAEHADLVVMGSKGKSDLQGLILGSVTHRVLHIASCPVLVVR